MSEATGIHAHPTLKLGRRPPKNAPALKLGEILSGQPVVPDHPTEDDLFTAVSSWILGGNDKFGTCGPTDFANGLLHVTTYLADAPVRCTDEAIFDLYRRSGNPGFDPNLSEGDPKQDDNGVDMQTMLEEAHRNGIQGPDGKVHKPLAFAKVDVSNEEEVNAAISIFGGGHNGADLEVVQQEQTDQGLWDYKRSSEWGGHAFYSPGYHDPVGTKQDRTKDVTWSMLIEHTDAFRAHQIEEAWVVIWEWHLGTKQFQEGIDAQKLAAAYTALTGDVLPVPSPPTPQPSPEPTPTPDPAPTPAPTPDPDDPVMAFFRALYAWLKDFFSKL